VPVKYEVIHKSCFPLALWQMHESKIRFDLVSYVRRKDLGTSPTITVKKKRVNDFQ
jgi:hypothetical protein